MQLTNRTHRGVIMSPFLPGDMTVFEGELFRLVSSTDGGLRSEVFTPDGWVPGGSIVELAMFGQRPSPEDVDLLMGKYKKPKDPKLNIHPDAEVLLEKDTPKISPEAEKLLDWLEKKDPEKAALHRRGLVGVEYPVKHPLR